MIRLDMTKSYKSRWDAPKGKNPRTDEEKAARLLACREASKKLSQAISNLSRSLENGLSYIMKLERPAAGGAGLHAHILCHLPDANAANLILKAIAGLFHDGKGLLQKLKDDPEHHERLIAANRLPFDVQGVSSFISNPDAELMGEQRAWNAAAYICKSADPGIEITMDGKYCRLRDVTPQQDLPSGMRHLQPIRAYQEQSLIDVGIKKHLRFSEDLEWRALRSYGFTIDDKAEDAGWLHKAERHRRSKEKEQHETNNGYENKRDADRIKSEKPGAGAENHGIHIAGPIVDKVLIADRSNVTREIDCGVRHSRPDALCT